MNKLILVLGVLLCTIPSLQAQNIEKKVMLVMDVSTTMLMQDILPDRFQKSKDLARLFINEHPDLAIGITVFAGDSKNICAPTKDHTLLQSHLESIKMNELKDGTATGSALLTAASCLKERGGTILLITDGPENCGTVSVSTAIEILKYFHIKLNVIGLGTNGMAPYPIENTTGEVEIVSAPTSIDSEYLSKMAKTTGGNYFEISSEADYATVIGKYKKPMWLETPRGIKVSNDFHLTEEVIQWVIDKTLGKEQNLSFPK